MKTDERISEILRRELGAEHIEVEDESWRHRGHAGAASGGGHFIVLVVSSAFEGKSPVERHQMVYAAVDSLMSEIHALSIKALVPEQWQAQQRSS